MFVSKNVLLGTRDKKERNALTEYTAVLVVTAVGS